MQTLLLSISLSCSSSAPFIYQVALGYRFSLPFGVEMGKEVGDGKSSDKLITSYDTE